MSRITKKELAEWTGNYIRNKDIITRSILGIESNKDGWDFIVHTKSGDRMYLVVPSIESFDDALKRTGENNVCIVAYNTKANLERISESWGELAALPKLSLMMVNPDSQLDKRWTIFPHTHDKITEKPALKKGLKAMFETVEEWKG